MKMNSKIWISFILIFLFGAAVGVGGTAFFVRSHIKSFMEGGPPAVNRRIIRKTLRGLELTESQRREVDRIILQYRPEVESSSREFGRTMRELTDLQLERIAEVLNEEQREIFDERIARFRAHFRKVFEEKGRDECWKNRRHREKDNTPQAGTG
jgi:hypothetical protein